jgi:hypothetical protein
MLAQATNIYRDLPYCRPEAARTSYSRYKLYQLLNYQQQIIDQSEEETLKLYRDLEPNDRRPLADLSDADFDKNIMFWSR